MFVKIQPFDVELFKLIYAAGVCTTTQAKELYNILKAEKDQEAKEWYPYKRTEKLVKEGYLCKEKLVLKLTGKSAKVIEQEQYRFEDDTRDTRIQVTNIILALLALKKENGFSHISSHEYRVENGHDRRVHYSGVIKHNNIEYVYYILPEKPTSQKISFIKTDIKTRRCNTIVFTTSKTSKEMFLAPSQHLFNYPIIFLPIKDGIKLLTGYFTAKTQEYIQSKLPSDAVKANTFYDASFADYKDSDNYYVDLILNELTKIDALTVTANP